MVPQSALSALGGKEEMERSALLYGKLRSLRLRLLENQDEKELDKNYQQHTRGVLERLETRLHLLGEQSPLRRVEAVMGRHGLYDAAFQQIVALNTGISPVLGDSLKELRSVQLGLLGEFQSILSDNMSAVQQMRKEFELEKSSTNVLKDECVQLLESVRLLDREADQHKTEILELRRRNKLLEANNIELNSELRILSSQQRTANKSSKPPMDLSFTQTTKFMRSTYSSNARSPTKSPLKSPLPPPPPPHEGTSFSTANNMNNNNNAATEWFYAFREQLQGVLDSGKCRVYGMHECKEVIDKLYMDKASRSSKQSSLAASSETMEMFVYRSMEKRYGLRSLAVEHVACLLRSVGQFSSKDNGVAVFQMIFCNEVDEGFRFVAAELEQSLREALLRQISASFPTKDKNFCNAVFEKKMGSAGTVTDIEWNEIINFLYNGADSAALNLILKRLAKSSSTEVASVANKGSSSRPTTLSTGVFIKTVLDFQLRAHASFLSGLRQAFISNDVNSDGVVSRNELLECFLQLRRSERASKLNGTSAKKFAKGKGTTGKVVVIRAPGEDADDSKREANNLQKDRALFAKLMAIIGDSIGGAITFSAAAAAMTKLCIVE